MLPNQTQVLGLVQNIISLLGGIAIGRGVLNAEQVTLIGGIATAVVPLVYSLIVNTDSAKLKAVTSMPEVQKIVVAPTADPASAAAQAATDRDQPKVTKS